MHKSPEVLFAQEFHQYGIIPTVDTKKYIELMQLAQVRKGTVKSIKMYPDSSSYGLQLPKYVSPTSLGDWDSDEKSISVNLSMNGEIFDDDYLLQIKSEAIDTLAHETWHAAKNRINRIIDIAKYATPLATAGISLVYCEATKAGIIEFTNWINTDITQETRTRVVQYGFTVYNTLTAAFLTRNKLKQHKSKEETDAEEFAKLIRHNPYWDSLIQLSRLK